mmetsp:Transcript_21344/g.20486  ORF Transcript_21344/g.20486 Transcript_21344/m.20486 type:complete len:127 (+) Transcript_21344:1135-1515(+)
MSLTNEQESHRSALWKRTTLNNQYSYRSSSITNGQSFVSKSVSEEGFALCFSSEVQLLINDSTFSLVGPQLKTMVVDHSEPHLLGKLPLEGLPESKMMMFKIIFKVDYVLTAALYYLISNLNNLYH